MGKKALFAAALAAGAAAVVSNAVLNDQYSRMNTFHQITGNRRSK